MPVNVYVHQENGTKSGKEVKLSCNSATSRKRDLFVCMHNEIRPHRTSRIKTVAPAVK